MNEQAEHILVLAGVNVSALKLGFQFHHIKDGDIGMQYQYRGEYPVLVYDHGDKGLSIFTGRDVTHGMVNVYRSGIFA